MFNKRFLDIFLLACCWGPGFLLTKLAVSTAPPFTLVTIRLCLASLVLWILLKIRGLKLPSSLALWQQLGFMGLIATAAPFVLFSYALYYIESVVSGLINGITPLLTAILAHFCLQDERLSLEKFCGIALGLIGFLVLLLPNFLNADLADDSIGMLWTFMASCCYAIGMVYARKNLQKLPPLLGPATQVITGTLLVAPLAFIVDNPSTLSIDTTAWLAIATLGTLSTVCAFILYFRIVEHSGATALSMVTYILPIFCSILGVAFLDEHIGWNFVLAAGLILGGVVLVNSHFKIFKRSSLA